MSSSNCCFLTCIQISLEVGKVIWYSHLFQNFPQFVVIDTVKGFGVVNKAEVDVFLELSCYFYDPVHVVDLISGTVGKHSNIRRAKSIRKSSIDSPKQRPAHVLGGYLSYLFIFECFITFYYIIHI